MGTFKVKTDLDEWKSIGSVEKNNDILPKDVNFYDYDGTLVRSYTADEFLMQNMLPGYPTHKGLIAQGWNWPVQAAKQYVRDNRSLNVGMSYITDDGKTRIYISIKDHRLLSLCLAFAVNGTVVVDWGDGSSTDTVTGSSNTTVIYTGNHTYETIGDYVIRLNVTNGTMAFYANNDEIGLVMPKDGISSGRRAFHGLVTRIEIGNGVDGVGVRGLQALYKMRTITIPIGSTFINDYGFTRCVSLNAIIIPYGMTVVKGNAFHSCYSMTVAVLSNILPTGSTSGMFTNVHSLSVITVPYSYTEIGNSWCANAYCLTSIVFPDFVTKINANSFEYASLQEIHFKRLSPPTVGSTNAFNYLPPTCKIYVPTGTLSAYTSATNYPSSSTYTYIEE